MQLNMRDHAIQVSLRYVKYNGMKRGGRNTNSKAGDMSEVRSSASGVQGRIVIARLVLFEGHNGLNLTERQF